MSVTETITNLVEYLNTCRDAYYNKNISIITDKQYDELFDKLKDLEASSGIILANSPTQTVGYNVVSGLKKVEHKYPLLSLDKCTSASEVKKFCGDDCVLFMYKLDGLTCQLTYKNGQLVCAETRGDGIIGEDITHNAITFLGVPKTIPIMEEIRITGEAIITRKDFSYINDQLGCVYKTPRNLASGSVRQLDSSICAKRKVRFIVWNANDLSTDDSMYSGLQKAEKLGFTTVFTVAPRGVLTESKIDTIISNMKDHNKTDYIPIDGIVIMFDSISFGESLGRTSHHFKNGIAYKFYNDSYTTIITGFDYTVGKSGVLTPTAIFDTVNIDGTDVSRASVHNISILKKLNLCIGDEVGVYKAKEIIPQIRVNYTIHDNSDDCMKSVPNVCPYCGHVTEIKQSDDSETLNLYCTNNVCKGKLLKKLSGFVSRDAMNIDGLSEKTLEKLIDLKIVSSYSDLYMLNKHRDTLKSIEGFGERSVDQLLKSIDSSKNVQIDKFICALNIDGVGKQTAKDFAKFINYDINNFNARLSNMTKLYNDLKEVSGFGEVVAKSITDWFSDSDNVREFIKLTTILKLLSRKSGDALSGMNFVITGKLNTFKSRDEMISLIESNGGCVQSSVTTSTSFLINNDIKSNSTKNKKAHELGIKIISEQDLIKMIDYNSEHEKQDNEIQHKPRRGLF